MAYKIMEYDKADEILDTRRARIQQAGDVTAGLAAFARGTTSRRREAFEDLWDRGRELVYGAVNAGGLGADMYGEFCLVIANPPRSSPAVLAVFPGDSMQRYTELPDVVHEAKAMEEVTSWLDRGHLAAIERCTEVEDDEAVWPGLVCSHDRYLEVVMAPGSAMSSVDEVRLPTGYIAELDELQAQDALGEDLTGEERNQIAAYDVIQSWRRSHGTTITEVD